MIFYSEISGFWLETYFMCPNIEWHEPMTHQCPASLRPHRYWYFHRWSYMQHWKADLGMNFIIIHNHASLCKIWKPCHWLFQLTIKLKSGTHNDPSILKQHSCQNLNQDMTHWFVIRYNIHFTQLNSLHF